MAGNPPDGEAPGGGDKPDGNPPEKPSGEDSKMEESKEAVLTIGDESIITVVDDDNNETQGSLADLTKGTSMSITFDETYESDGTDENAIHVTDGAKVSLDNVTVNRTSDDSTDRKSVV